MIGFFKDLTPKEKVDMLTWRNDASVRRFCRDPKPIKIKEHEAWLKGIDPERTLLGAFRTPEGTIGIGRLDFSHSTKSAEFSIYLDPKQHGKGLAVEAMRELMDAAFTKPEFKMMWGVTHESNIPARKTFHKAGMKADGVKDGPWVRYSILRVEWATLPQLP